ncbi:hypothetical protein KC131_24800 [Pseudomonas sp. JQ170]|uniref:hypothetical protein n=1 Tax=unclassified Pseudomonas TaxID=196821 RepID=UPI002651970E|nr:MULTISPECIES: hypothetical protein [unclassified Pseudomonas]MDN7143868.1 hypothetical protein [Pseudomonas sp. JQ170]WRO74222.1 hypothetical protein U9R80_17030 [Pseudomonas sp. 170C]
MATTDGILPPYKRCDFSTGVNSMSTNANEAMLEKLRTEAVKLGIDPTLVQLDDISVAKTGDKMRFKWRDIEIEAPSPSQETFDSWFEQNGQVIAGAAIALAGVTLGIIASAASSFKR